MSSVLLVISFVLALIATAMAFTWFGTDGTDALGYFAASFAVYLGSLVARDRAL